MFSLCTALYWLEVSDWLCVCWVSCWLVVWRGGSALVSIRNVTKPVKIHIRRMQILTAYTFILCRLIYCFFFFYHRPLYCTVLTGGFWLVMRALGKLLIGCGVDTDCWLVADGVFRNERPEPVLCWHHSVRAFSRLNAVAAWNMSLDYWEFCV